MLRVLFRVDDGPDIGAGHMMRCLALAEAVHERGGAVHLSATRASPLHADWKRLASTVQIEPRKIGGNEDLSTTLAMARSVKADWLVADGYRFDTRWLDAAAAERLTVCMDDLGQRDPAVHLVINQNSGAEQRYDSAYRRCDRSLLGLKWFLLRRAWIDLHPKPEPRRLVLTLGGEDPGNLIFDLMLALLADGRTFVADVVSTAPDDGFGKIAALASTHPDRFTLHRGPVPLPPLMARASVVVSGGGVTPVEAIFVGVPPVIVVLADNQVPGAAHLAAVGAALATPVETGIAKAAGLALDILHDDAAKARMSACGRGLVDGGGAARILSVMESMGSSRMAPNDPGRRTTS